MPKYTGKGPQPKAKKPKPNKPSPDFPLYPHAAGRWAKKVLGRTHYFTRWDEDPKGKAGLLEWLEKKDALLAGREPEPNVEGLTLYDLCQEFLAVQEGRRDNAEISPITFGENVGTCKNLCKLLGKNRKVLSFVPADFRKLRTKLSKSRSAVTLGNAVQQVRSVFRFAYVEGFIDRPVKFGSGFSKPNKRVVRKAKEAYRSEYGDKMFEAQDLRLILDSLDGKEVTLDRINEETGEPEKVKVKRNPQLRAMVLLAANAAFGQTDISTLPRRALDLEGGWIDFPRPKTSVPRKIPLWKETIEALEEWNPLRGKPKDKADSSLVFLTSFGTRWVRVHPKTGLKIDSLGQEFNKLLKKLGLKRPRIGFYAIRHGFETIGGESIDQVSVDSIMGHVPQGMAGEYRERISEKRLRDVVELVRRWVFAEEEPKEDGPIKAKPKRKKVKKKKPRKASTNPKDDEPPTLRLFAG